MWVCVNLIKFKSKCKVLHVGWGNPKHHERMGDKWVEGSPEEKDWGVLVIKKLNMSWQCALVAQGMTDFLGCTKSMASRSRKVIGMLRLTSKKEILNISNRKFRDRCYSSEQPINLHYPSSSCGQYHSPESIGLDKVVEHAKTSHMYSTLITEKLMTTKLHSVKASCTHYTLIIV